MRRNKFHIPWEIINEKYAICVSGGVDSMAMLHFLSRQKDRIKCVVHVNHNTGEYADRCEHLVRETAVKYEIPTCVKRLGEIPEGTSKENFWRNERLNFYEEVAEKKKVGAFLTAHHLDDALETYIMTVGHGKSKVIPWISEFKRFEICHPFLRVQKRQLIKYAKKHSLEFLEDPTNSQKNYCTRNNVRLLMPALKEAMPSLERSVDRILEDKLDDYGTW